MGTEFISRSGRSAGVRRWTLDVGRAVVNVGMSRLDCWIDVLFSERSRFPLVVAELLAWRRHGTKEGGCPCVEAMKLGDAAGHSAFISHDHPGIINRGYKSPRNETYIYGPSGSEMRVWVDGVMVIWFDRVG
jgi:hypothetical protein